LSKPAYQGYLIDLDGTIYRGNEKIEGAAEFIDAIAGQHIPYLFVTNNAAKTQEDISQKLNHLGIQSTPEQIVTSSIATAKYIKDQKAGASCYVIGGNGLRRAIENQGLNITDTEHCDFVVMGIDHQISYEKFAKACLAVHNGAHFISTNSDKILPTNRGLMPGNGALTSVVSVSTGKEPTFIGKPEAIIMDQAMKLLQVPKEQTLMVGDNYQTDIQAGMKAGLDTLMVFTGVTSKEELAYIERKPTYHAENLTEWIAHI